ncbi:hypothetical protein PMALA_049680 [Plasmodium malariae]|uniref:Uncharacterized protein n=1 Tax=Plasmodium malariae TaxID=5858 RepID=A0A1A8WSD0_PLAMA|nr:hypothetical protein PMALA_049680 [Plasmodium malariae]
MRKTSTSSRIFKCHLFPPSHISLINRNKPYNKHSNHVPHISGIPKETSKINELGSENTESGEDKDKRMNPLH